MRLAKIVLLIMISCFSVGKMYASNMSFLNYSAMYYFTEKDSKLMMANMLNALNNYRDGQKSTWQNPNTGASGYAIPFNTRTQQGVKCRDLRIFNLANNVPGESKYSFCKVNNKWQLNLN